MATKYKTHIIFLLIVILWLSAVAPKYKKTIIVEEVVGEVETIIEPTHIDLKRIFDFDKINNIKLDNRAFEEVVDTRIVLAPYNESITEAITPEPTEEPTALPTPTPTSTPSPTPKPTPTPTPQSEWMPYLATSYSGQGCGNRGEDLSNRNAIAMWQSDTNYLSYHTMCEEYKEWYRNHSGYDYGALPYGTKVEIRIWTGSDYRYMGVYELIDDSPTTQRNLSQVARNLHSDTTKPFYFDYTWHNIDYKGRPVAGGERKGYITNWKPEYNWCVKGWVDVKGAGWGTVIVEMRIVK